MLPVGRGVDLPAHVAQPVRALLALDAGLGDQHRAPEPLVPLEKHVAQRAVVALAAPDLASRSIEPLVGVVVIESDHVHVPRPAPQLRAPAAGQHLHRLELQEPVALGGVPLLRVTRAGEDVDHRLGVDDPTAGGDRPTWPRSHGSRRARAGPSARRPAAARRERRTRPRRRPTRGTRSRSRA